MKWIWRQRRVGCFQLLEKSKEVPKKNSLQNKIIVDSIGGTISVKNDTFNYNNKEHKGAKFTIGLPLQS